MASFAGMVVLDAGVVVLDALVADRVMDVAAVGANGVAWNHEACVSVGATDGAKTAVMASDHVHGDDYEHCSAVVATRTCA